MSVYIYQQDALALMTMVEGNDWRRQQESHPRSAFGFSAYLAAWHARDLIDSDGVHVEGGDGTIYGKEGYSRYKVAKDGRIVLLRWSTRAERIALAESVGFDIA